MLEIGTKVRIRKQMEQIGIVKEIGSEIAREIYYGVEFMDKMRYLPESSLLIYSEQRSVKENLIRSEFGLFYDFQKAITYLKLINSDSIQNNIYSFNTSRTMFMEYQFKPLLKFINSYKRRLLICDEVGLGKTIEAGLILKELDARKELRNVLIVVPANLRSKWKNEMFYRFGEDFNFLDGKTFRKIEEGDDGTYSRFANPKFIVSMESIRSKNMRDIIERSDQRWDLMIVDEAHSLRNSSQQHKAIKMISNNVEAIVMLTATPIHTSNENLFNILNILDDQQFEYYPSFQEQLRNNEPVVQALNAISLIHPNLLQVKEMLTKVEGHFQSNMIFKDTISRVDTLLESTNQIAVGIEDIVYVQRNLSDLHLIGGIYNRTRKRDVHTNRPIRDPHTVSVKYSIDELTTYNFIVSAIKTMLHSKGKHASLLPLFSIQRMLSSSLHAHKSLINTKYDLTSFSMDDYEDFLFDELDDTFADLPLNWEKTTPDEDSKFIKLLEVLNNSRLFTNKIIIFAFYTTTLSYLQKLLTDKGIKTFLLTGKLAFSERNGLLDSFREESAFCILLSSRVGSEGIDLQFCDTIINFDLPWNPMEIEQRIGRIDRIGQASPKIKIINFGMEDTIDDSIILRLYERINLFEGTIGLLEPIMGDLIREVNKNIFYKELTKEEMEQKWEEEEKIIELKIKTAEDLEAAASNLLSLDYFYEHEIKNIKKKKRFISPYDLFQYISGYLKNKYDDSYMKYDFKINTGELCLGEQFKREVRDTIFKEDIIHTYSPGKVVSFTLDSNHAFENQEQQFITILHPLVKFITYQYSLNQSQLHNCHYFMVKKGDLHDNEIELQPGYFFYFVFLATITSYRKHSLVFPVILGEDLTPVGDNDLCEHLLGVVLERGKHNVQEVSCPNAEYIEQAYSIAFTAFKKRFGKYYDHFKSRQEMIISRKIESREYRFFQKTNPLVEELVRLSNEQSGEETSFRRSMLEAQVKKRTEDYKKDMEDIDLEKACYPSFEEPMFGGVFEVIDVK